MIPRRLFYCWHSTYGGGTRMTAIFVLLINAVFLQVPFIAAQGSCRFPSRWEGEWFQSGVRQPIVIQGDRATTKGRCLASEGDKFLVVDDKGCYRCVVIHEKHPNVLQYKETYCHNRNQLGPLCSLITGDALLYSMFRVSASPVACPFRGGSYSFSYNRGHGECGSPASSLDPCTEDWRVLLRFQACPDVAGTESSVEELECVAAWKEGSARYLVGRLRHLHATSDEERYRCFVYEKAGGEMAGEPGVGGNVGVTGGGGRPVNDPRGGVDFWVAQSGDATCNGLFTPMEGSRTLKLRKANSQGRGCRYPNWLAAHTHWHTLDHASIYHVTHRNATLRVVTSESSSGQQPQPQDQDSSGPHEAALPWKGGGEARLACTDIKMASSHRATLVAHFTHGCKSGFVCLAFYRRDPHVIEMQAGVVARRAEEACLPQHFEPSTVPFITLVTASPEPRECPHAGRFVVAGGGVGADLLLPPPQSSEAVMAPPGGCTADITSLAVGCAAQDTMEFRTSTAECNRALQMQPAAYSCHGGWEDNGTHFLITTPLSRTSHGARRLCFMFRGGPGEVLRLSSSAASCSRAPPPAPPPALTLTSSGQCVVESGASRPTQHLLFLVVGVVLTTMAALSS